MRRRNSFSSCSALPVRSGVGGPARIVCRVDGAKLAAIYEHLVRDQRASLHSGNVSHFHSLRTFHGGATGLVWHHYFLVANVYGALYNALRAGRVGVLTLSWLATLLHYEPAVEGEDNPSTPPLTKQSRNDASRCRAIRCQAFPKTERPGLARPHTGCRRHSAPTGHCPHPSNPAPLTSILFRIQNSSM